MLIENRNLVIYLEERRCRICGKVFKPNCSRHWYCSPECFKLRRLEYLKKYMREYRRIKGFGLGTKNFNDLHIVHINGKPRIRSAVILENYINHCPSPIDDGEGYNDFLEF